MNIGCCKLLALLILCHVTGLGHGQDEHNEIQKKTLNRRTVGMKMMNIGVGVEEEVVGMLALRRRQLQQAQQALRPQHLLPRQLLQRLRHLLLRHPLLRHQLQRPQRLRHLQRPQQLNDYVTYNVHNNCYKNDPCMIAPVYVDA
ncbi:hypothetical protein B566_EDAN017109 [Ephemera danica]|nr:hypothetical protein B566_EDAN017109 [Ephemera danica]